MQVATEFVDNAASIVASPLSKQRKANPIRFVFLGFGYTVRNSYASKFQYIRIILIKLIRYISSIAPKGLINPQF